MSFPVRFLYDVATGVLLIASGVSWSWLLVLAAWVLIRGEIGEYAGRRQALGEAASAIDRAERRILDEIDRRESVKRESVRRNPS